jgi:hypothetical protein
MYFAPKIYKMFTAILFVIVKKLKQFKCALTVEGQVNYGTFV